MYGLPVGDMNCLARTEDRFILGAANDFRMPFFTLQMCQKFSLERLLGTFEVDLLCDGYY